MSALLVIAVLAALPVLAAVGARIARRRAGRLLRPSAVLVVASAIVFAGGRHFENGWPGTGGHGGLIPGGVAAFEWATSLSVSSYWAHPGALGAFPALEVAWMAVCPLAQAVAVASAAVVVRRVRPLRPGAGVRDPSRRRRLHGHDRLAGRLLVLGGDRRAAGRGQPAAASPACSTRA